MSEVLSGDLLMNHLCNQDMLILQARQEGSRGDYNYNLSMLMLMVMEEEYLMLILGIVNVKALVVKEEVM